MDTLIYNVCGLDGSLMSLSHLYLQIFLHDNMNNKNKGQIKVKMLPKLEEWKSRLSCVFPAGWSIFTKYCVRVANKAVSSNEHVEQSIGLESKSGNTHCRVQTVWLISSKRKGDISKMNSRGKDPVKVKCNPMEIFLFNLWCMNCVL